MELLTKLTAPECMPTRANPTDAGLDLRTSEAYVLKPLETKLFDCGVAFKIPPNYVGLVFVRSGVGKHNVSPTNCVGVIDSDYRGNVMVSLCNYSDRDYEIKQFDRIAQLVVMPIELPTITVQNWTDEAWNDTQRGTNGFGSTGT